MFLGTPEFAVGSLSILVGAGYNIVGVITAPDRRGGRGLKQIIESDVKKYALSKNLLILQPTNLKNPVFLEKLRSLGADLQVVVAFRMLPIAVWDMPKFGTYNLHASLLPRFRGAAPINWAIMNGNEWTGVTTFKLKHEIDTGSIALQEKVPIHPGDYLDTVHDNLKEKGATLILRTVDGIVDESLTLVEQDSSRISKAPKIYHSDCAISFTESVKKCFDKVRGLSPYPVAWFLWQGKKFKIYKATYSYDKNKIQPGTILTDTKNYFGIACIDGVLFVQQIKAEGKKKMQIKDFLNGMQLKGNSLPSQTQISKLWSW